MVELKEIDSKLDAGLDNDGGFDIVTNEEAASAKMSALPEEEYKRRAELAKKLAGK